MTLLTIILEISHFKLWWWFFLSASNFGWNWLNQQFVFSAGNVTLNTTYECFGVEVEEPRYISHGSKIVLPKHECPVTICTTDRIGTVKSRRLLWVLFDSGSTVSMIKRSTLPQNVVTKAISETKNITTLACRVQAQEVVTLRDLRLPEFDKTGA